jgi:hypothetical protein
MGIPPPPSTTPTEYAMSLVEKMHYAHEVARTLLLESALQNKAWYDHKVRPESFKVDDRVLVYYPRRYRGKNYKWQRLYSTEGIVTQKLNDVTYVIKSPRWKNNSRVVHVDKLKLTNDFEPAP